MVIKAENVSKSYGDNKALDDVSFILTNGVVALLGNNGAGKTTLINILAGILKADTGRVTFDDADCLSYGRQYRDRLGFLPQECSFYSGYSGYEFMEYMAAIKNVDRKNKKERIEKYLRLVNLWENRNKKIREYSGGMRHRLGIAQAMLNEPEFLILDEPTTGLDFIERNNFRQLIKEYSKKAIVLISTHILSDVDDIADKVLVLKKGRVVTYADVEDDENITEKYGNLLFEKEGH